MERVRRVRFGGLAVRASPVGHARTPRERPKSSTERREVVTTAGSVRFVIRVIVARHCCECHGASPPTNGGRTAQCRFEQRRVSTIADALRRGRAYLPDGRNSFGGSSEYRPKSL